MVFFNITISIYLMTNKQYSAYTSHDLCYNLSQLTAPARTLLDLDGLAAAAGFAFG